MPKYEFHNCLDPERFEHFSCAVISVRENRTFQRFSAGKDGGIDGLYCSEDGKIILQAKRIQTSKGKLLSIMRNEGLKAKYLNADRYILVLSMSISNVGLKDEICDLFQGAIKDTQDIITCEDLNGYLEDSKYKQVELAYQELWLKSSNVLSQLLYDNINKGVLQKIEGHLRRIEEAVKTYVPSAFFYDALKMLQTKQYVMLSGEPGVGKTTTAYNLAHYFAEREGYEQIFVVENIEEIYQLNDSNKKQVFVLDDFWGRIKFSMNYVDVNWEKRLLNILDDIKYFRNSLLIITTREFVLQQGIRCYTEVGERCEHEKILIDMNAHTLIQKAEILFQHVYQSNLDWDYVYIIYLRNKEIIEHPNFNPRIISYFCKNISTEGKSIWEYFAEIKRFMSAPYKYWDDTLRNLSAGAKYICFALEMSEEAILLSELEKTFLGIVEYGFEQVNREDFSSYIKEQQDMFIYVYECDEEDEMAVDFINHSLRDFFEKYIIKHIKVYENMFIRGLKFFNQLNYILYENPFGMSDVAVEMGIKRLIENIDLLKFSYLYNMDVSSDYTVVHDTKAYYAHKVWRLMLMYQNQKYQILTDFFTSYVNSVYQGLRREETEFGYRELINIAEIVPRLYKCKIQVPVKPFIESYYKKANWVEQLYYMDLCFSKIFGKIYQDFRTINLKEIQTNILNFLPDDIESFLYEDEWELEMFIDHLPKIFKQFDMQYTEDLRNEVYEWAEYYIETEEVDNNRKVSVIEHREEPEDRDINEYLETEIRSWLLCEEEYLEEDTMERLIEDYPLSLDLKTKLLEHKYTYIWNGDFINDDFYEVLNYLDQINKIPDNIYQFYNGFSKYLEKNIDSNIALEQVHELAKILLQNKSSIFTEDSIYIQNWKHTVGTEFLWKLCEVGILHKNNKWLCFINDNLLVYYGVIALFTAGHDEKLSFYKKHFMELLYEKNNATELILYFAQNLDRRLLNEFVIMEHINDFLEMNTELQEELKIKKFLQLIDMVIYRENGDFGSHRLTSYPALELLDEIEYSFVSVVWDDLTTFAKLMLDSLDHSRSDKMGDMEVEIYPLTDSPGWYDLMCKNDLHRNITQLYFVLKETQKYLRVNGYNVDVFAFWKQFKS